jgi:hypothetical protein
MRLSIVTTKVTVRLNAMTLSVTKSFYQLVNRLSAKLQCGHRNSLIGTMDGLRKIELGGEGHGQEPVSLDSQPGEKAAISSSG